MNIFTILKTQIKTTIQNLFDEGKISVLPNMERITAEPPRDASHGDVATNVAMVCAGQVGLKPRDFASLVALELEALPSIESVEVAGPGFINLKLSNAFWYEQLQKILKEKENYGSSNMGAGEKINIEFCSANPTGPMHVGHVRGAIFGDALAGLLSKAGFDVTREYYMNDRGVQMQKLAKTVYLRYREALGENIGEIPEGYYPGDYLKPVGQFIADEDGDKWIGKPEEEWLNYFLENHMIFPKYYISNIYCFHFSLF